MRAGVFIISSLLISLSGCAHSVTRAPRESAEARLIELDGKLSRAEKVWAEAIDDPWTESDLRRRYTEMQYLCRECASRKQGFATVREKNLCDRVKDPFIIYFNSLYVRTHGLEEQIAVKERPGASEPDTVAYEYKRRPSTENIEKLRGVFNRIHRYYVGWPYTWTRYINKYPFQKSRVTHFKKAFADRDREYLELAARPDADRYELQLARKRAEFAFDRLKKEYVTNDLPPAAEVNAFYRACDLDDYHRLSREERERAAIRKAERRLKEVVVFVHGLSENRSSWGGFPVLLADEDIFNRDMSDRYFKVYVFSYDTVEDSKSIEGFKNELGGFISDIIRDEGVEKIHLIGHSFGSVLCLKYMNHEADRILKGVDRQDPERVAAALLAAHREGKIKQTVGSFISIAGSLSGSEIANIAGDRFIPPKRLFRSSLPVFRGGVPGYGDIQVRENQLGSEVNLTSFWRLDTERPLSPPDLLHFLPPDKRPSSDTLKILKGAAVPSLCIIGDPFKIQSLTNKEGFLKLGEGWKIFWIDGPLRLIQSFRRYEDDGLVKACSANLNHTYLLPSGDDIGYKGAEVRCSAYGHFSISGVSSRDHPTYRYVMSFLNGALVPQMESRRYRLRRFGIFLRVFPEGLEGGGVSEAFFMPEEKIVYVHEGKLVIPAIRIEKAGRRAAKESSENIRLAKPQWNRMTGVCFYEGRISDIEKPARVVFRLSADGYREKYVSVPVRPGEVSYAVNIILERDGR